MAVVGDILPHCIGTGVETDPYIYNTIDGFLEAINVFNAYVEAGVDNLIFDALETPVSQIEFVCKQIDGKNTTIRNLLANNETKNLIGLYSSAGYNITIKNMNFFNITIISNSSNIKPKIIGTYGNIDARQWKHELYNCNFTAILIGVPHTEGYIQTFTNYYTNTNYFNGCSFNFVLKFNSGVSGSVSIFRQLESDYIQLNNCALKFSGESYQSGNANLYLLEGVKATDCVILNSQTSSLENKRDGRILINLTSDSGYNYMKMHTIINDGSLALDNCNTLLVNKSKIDDPSKINGACILMQEEDSTANDYIYNETNLSNAGFLIGTVVE
jgi:hypothetical protein